MGAQVGAAAQARKEDAWPKARSPIGLTATREDLDWLQSSMRGSAHACKTCCRGIGGAESDRQAFTQRGLDDCRAAGRPSMGSP